jgi:hypothetical protein
LPSSRRRSPRQRLVRFLAKIYKEQDFADCQATGAEFFCGAEYFLCATDCTDRAKLLSQDADFSAAFCRRH